MCGARKVAKSLGAKEGGNNDMRQMQDAQQQAMEGIATQNQALVEQLRAQAQMITDQTAARQRELEAAKAPGQTLVNANPYTVSLGQGTAGAGQEQTTAPAAPKKKPGQNRLALDVSVSGVGLNLGI